VVEELPQFAPSGTGDHLHLRVQKRGLTTEDVLRALARELDVPRREIGYAGLKDKHAVTVQSFSLPFVSEDAVRALAIPGIEVLSMARHHRKLRRAQAAGNRFRIRLHAPDGSDGADLLEPVLRPRLDELEPAVPNYFGVQRFGARATNHLVGRALVADDPEDAARWIAGRPLGSERDPRALAARTAFDAGDYEAAARAFPGYLGAERHLARQLARRPGDFAHALGRLERREREFYVGAFQSYLFNRQVEDQIQRGARDPFGQMPGWKTLDDPRLAPARDFVARCLPRGTDPVERMRALRLEGERRRLWLAVGIALECAPATATLAFALPNGSFATAITRELLRDDPPIMRLERDGE